MLDTQMRLPETKSAQEIPWLENERFMLALDAQEGALTAPPSGNDVLTITNQRAIKVASSAGVQTTALVPLAALRAIGVEEANLPGHGGERRAAGAKPAAHGE